MSKLREKAQGLTKQTVGQMIGDDELVREGKEQQQKAGKDEQSNDGRSDTDDQDPPAKRR